TSWAIFDPSLNQPDRMMLSRTITRVSATNKALTLSAGQPDFQTGDAVVYTANDPANPLAGLTDGRTYFVVRTDATHVQLADSLANALAGMVRDLGPSTLVGQLDNVIPPNTLSLATTLANIQGLFGGSGNDTFIETLPKQAGQAPLSAFNGTVLSV